MIDEILEYEKYFSQNNYLGNTDKVFEIEDGVGNIMLSAPHATKHPRNNKMLPEEVLTGGIVKYLHRITKCPIIYSDLLNMDPNYDKGNLYQTLLALYI